MSSQWTVPVVLAISAAFMITVVSWYYSVFYLPRRMDKAYRTALYALAAAVETKDSGTIGHAERVADYAMAVAKDLGIRGSESRTIEYAALLRDIGKVNVPASVLNKSTALEPDEWEKVKSHARFGAEMVQSVPFLGFLTELIRHHHECWDGSGYPDGLAGEDIPLGSRILAVATDYDAITSERPYHEPRSPEVAVKEIEDGRGTKYDPSVVDAFFRVLQIESAREQSGI